MLLAALLVKLLWLGAGVAVTVAVVTGFLGATREAMQ